jgi:hypothetical protein
VRVYIYGTIQYRDAFGCWHYTNFCVWYTGIASPEVTACARDNDADEGASCHALPTESHGTLPMRRCRETG